MNLFNEDWLLQFYGNMMMKSVELKHRSSCACGFDEVHQ